ncbi:MAG: cupredoxin domain-containing protein [Acidobacteriaceae bacterium]|nr:cupredoxin domain-containing protein [Acidobacteriaceae bacterium]
MHSATALLVFLRWPLPADVAAHGHALDRHLLLNLNLALAFLALAHVLLFAGLMLRRRDASAQHKVMAEYVPLAGFALLFFLLAAHAQTLWANERFTGASPEALQIEVTGMQFAWYFRYPGQDAAFGETRPELVDAGEGNPLGIVPTDERGKDDFVSAQLVLPAGREVDLALRSLDVIHGFAIPEMRVKQNAVPGQTTHLHFTAEKPGEYALLCTQVCGLGHYRMSSTVRVLTPEAYAAWLSAREVHP